MAAGLVGRYRPSPKRGDLHISREERHSPSAHSYRLPQHRVESSGHPTTALRFESRDDRSKDQTGAVAVPPHCLLARRGVLEYSLLLRQAQLRYELWDAQGPVSRTRTRSAEKK